MLIAAVVHVSDVFQLIACRVCRVPFALTGARKSHCIPMHLPPFYYVDVKSSH